MIDNMYFIETQEIDFKIEIIRRQTNYTEETARIKLREFNYDHISVIKSYLGIVNKIPEMKSLNQEIYKQLRYTLDGAIRSYNVRKENGETKIS